MDGQQKVVEKRKERKKEPNSSREEIIRDKKTQD